jgi:hypothetical protein
LRGTPTGSSTPGVVALTVATRAADPLALERGGLAPSAVLVAGYPGAWTPATVAVVDRATYPLVILGSGAASTV